MAKELKVGDIVEQTCNGGWWFMAHECPISNCSLTGYCVRRPPGTDAYPLGSTSPFSKTSDAYSGPRATAFPRDESGVPDDVWAEIARLGLEGKMCG